GLFRAMRRHQPDAYLVRNLAGMRYFLDEGFSVISDFSLNATNELSVDWLMRRGVCRVTPSYDLNRQQLIELIGAVPSRWLEIVVHQHMPMFHMEHCVFCSVLSPGTNKTNCGRPCDRHVVQLRDRAGMEHPLQADVACRNTLYNAQAQSGAEVIPSLIAAGIGVLRIELLDESADEMRLTFELY
ncbi:MAG: U32 family peptidase, partial [Verrucomicrobiae bacterium]|nr:U32 family peptidase [Verrucomicrobiae bacterium]